MILPSQKTIILTDRSSRVQSLQCPRKGWWSRYFTSPRLKEAGLDGTTSLLTKSEQSDRQCGGLTRRSKPIYQTIGAATHRGVQSLLMGQTLTLALTEVKNEFSNLKD